MIVTCCIVTDINDISMYVLETYYIVPYYDILIIYVYIYIYCDN